MLDMPYVQVVRRPACCAHRREPQCHNHISTDSVVLIYCLRVVHASIQRWRVILREADQGLKEDGDVECETKDGMWGLKMFMSRSSFVDLDYDKPGEEGGDPNEVDKEVGYGAGTFLGGCVGRLEDEGRLSYEEKASRVEQRMRGEEYELIR